MAAFDPSNDPRPCARALELIACELAGAMKTSDAPGLTRHLEGCPDCASSRRKLRRLVRAIRQPALTLNA